MLTAGVAQAGPLTFAQALDRAGSAPSIAADAKRVEAARLSASTATQLPDPKVEVGIQDFPVTGRNAGSFTRDDFTMAVVGVSQEFPNPAKRRARLGRAQADIGAAQATQAAQARNVKTETALAWVDLYFVQRKLAALKNLEESIGDLEPATTAGLVAGSARPADILEPRQLKADIGDRRAELIARAEKARATLARWTGDPDVRVEGRPPDWQIDEVALQNQIHALPALRARDAATTQAEADVRLARADKRPDWEVSASYGYRANYGDFASVGVKIDLPLFTRKRQEPLIAARARGADAVRLDRDAAERELRASLRASVADHAMHHDRFVRARDVLVPLARQRADLDRSSYAAGTVTLRIALSSAVALAEAELDALDREIAVAREVILINLTFGDDSQ